MAKGLRKIFAGLVALIFVVSASGCSFLAPSTQRLRVMASEPDAEIFVNGQLIGTGTAETRVRKDESVSVMAKKEGFYPAAKEIDTELSTVGIVDLGAGSLILLPLLGLLAPGAHQLQKSSISLKMEKVKE